MHRYRHLISRGRTQGAVVAGMALAITLLGGTPGHAAEQDDARAVRIDGDVTNCEGAGFTGTRLDPGDLTAVGGKAGADRYVSIEAVADGVAITGVVVKGGPAYNSYVPGARGLAETEPWTELRAPINPGGKLPAISHWFACGAAIAASPLAKPEPAPVTPEPRAQVPVGSPAAPAGGTSRVTSAAAAMLPSALAGPGASGVTPVEEPPGPTERAEDASSAALAFTGFGAVWMLWLGAALVLIGGTVLVLLRIRRRGD